MKDSDKLIANADCDDGLGFLSPSKKKGNMLKKTMKAFSKQLKGKSNKASERISMQLLSSHASLNYEFESYDGEDATEELRLRNSNARIDDAAKSDMQMIHEAAPKGQEFFEEDNNREQQDEDDEDDEDDVHELDAKDEGGGKPGSMRGDFMKENTNDRSNSEQTEETTASEKDQMETDLFIEGGETEAAQLKIPMDAAMTSTTNATSSKSTILDAFAKFPMGITKSSRPRTPKGTSSRKLASTANGMPSAPSIEYNDRSPKGRTGSYSPPQRPRSMNLSDIVRGMDDDDDDEEENATLQSQSMANLSTMKVCSPKQTASTKFLSKNGSNSFNRRTLLANGLSPTSPQGSFASYNRRSISLRDIRSSIEGTDFEEYQKQEPNLGNDSVDGNDCKNNNNENQAAAQDARHTPKQQRRQSILDMMQQQQKTNPEYSKQNRKILSSATISLSDIRRMMEAGEDEVEFESAELPPSPSIDEALRRTTTRRGLQRRFSFDSLTKNMTDGDKNAAIESATAETTTTTDKDSEKHTTTRRGVPRAKTIAAGELQSAAHRRRRVSRRMPAPVDLETTTNLGDGQQQEQQQEQQQQQQQQQGSSSSSRRRRARVKSFDDTKPDDNSSPLKDRDGQQAKENFPQSVHNSPGSKSSHRRNRRTSKIAAEPSDGAEARWSRVSRGTRKDEEKRDEEGGEEKEECLTNSPSVRSRRRRTSARMQQRPSLESPLTGAFRSARNVTETRDYAHRSSRFAAGSKLPDDLKVPSIRDLAQAQALAKSSTETSAAGELSFRTQRTTTLQTITDNDLEATPNRPSESETQKEQEQSKTEPGLGTEPQAEAEQDSQPQPQPQPPSPTQADDKPAPQPSPTTNNNDNNESSNFSDAPQQGDGESMRWSRSSGSSRNSSVRRAKKSEAKSLTSEGRAVSDKGDGPTRRNSGSRRMTRKRSGSGSGRSSKLIGDDNDNKSPRNDSTTAEANNSEPESATTKQTEATTTTTTSSSEAAKDTQNSHNGDEPSSSSPKRQGSGRHMSSRKRSDDTKEKHLKTNESQQAEGKSSGDNENGEKAEQKSRSSSSGSSSRRMSKRRSVRHMNSKSSLEHSTAIDRSGHSVNNSSGKTRRSSSSNTPIESPSSSSTPRRARLSESTQRESASAAQNLLVPLPENGASVEQPVALSRKLSGEVPVRKLAESIAASLSTAQDEYSIDVKANNSKLSASIEMGATRARNRRQQIDDGQYSTDSFSIDFVGGGRHNASSMPDIHSPEEVCAAQLMISPHVANSSLDVQFVDQESS